MCVTIDIRQREQPELCGTPLDPKEVSVEIAKPESGIEAIARKTDRVEAGKYQFTTSDLVIVGTWELKVGVLIDDFTRRDIVALVPIERPSAGIAQARPVERGNVAYGALSIARGQAVYEQNCAACHGVEGYGNGVAAGALARRPANLTSDHLFHHGDDMLFDWVSNGIADTPMPAFAGLLTENERWDVLHFLRAQAEIAGY